MANDGGYFFDGRMMARRFLLLAPRHHGSWPWPVNTGLALHLPRHHGSLAPSPRVACEMSPRVVRAFAFAFASSPHPVTTGTCSTLKTSLPTLLIFGFAAARLLVAQKDAQLHRAGQFDLHCLITPGEFESRPKINN